MSLFYGGVVAGGILLAAAAISWRLSVGSQEISLRFAPLALVALAFCAVGSIIVRFLAVPRIELATRRRWLLARYPRATLVWAAIQLSFMAAIILTGAASLVGAATGFWAWQAMLGAIVMLVVYAALLGLAGSAITNAAVVAVKSPSG